MSDLAEGEYISGAVTLTSNERAQNPAALYLASLGSKESRRVVGSRLNSVAKLAGKPDWKAIDWTGLDRAWLLTIKEVMVQKEQSLSAINGTLSALRGVAKQAWELEIIEQGQFLRINNTPNMKGKRVRKKRLVTGEEIVRLLKAATHNKGLAGLRNLAIIATTYGTGLRRAEVVGIDLKHIDQTKQSIRILGKGNKERIVYPPDWAWEILGRWIEEGRGDYPGPVFVRIRKGDDIKIDKRLSAQAVRNICNELSELSDVEKFSPHDLRAAFITHLLTEGEDIKTVSRLVGHSSVKTTEDYDRRGEEAKKEVNRRLNISL